MRKAFLCAVIALLLCGAFTAGYAASAEASDSQPAASDIITGFGLHKVYTNNNPVILRADGEPYYGNVSSFVLSDPQFAAKLKDKDTDIDHNSMPLGTLTDMTSGLNYRLDRSGQVGDLFYYYLTGSGQDIYSIAGHRVIWNLYTSPDVTVGAVTVPENGSSVSIPDDVIVPYVKLHHGTNYDTEIGRLDLFFVKSGDWSTPVALGDTTVIVWSHQVCYEEFTSFNKPVREGIYLGCDESEFTSLTVRYELNGIRYEWIFKPQFADGFSSIEWGKLALDNQPLKVYAGSSVDVEIKLPGRLDLEEFFSDENNFNFGYNGSMINIDRGSVSFDQGSFSWDDLTANGGKSTLSFTIDGLEPGRTVLSIWLPYLGQYYREINVLSADESMHIEESSDTHGITLGVTRYESRARFLNGKPYYPSAEFSDMKIALNTPDSIDLGWGFLGIINGTTTEIHNFGNSDIKGEIFQSGVRYNTADSADNTNYPGYLTLKDKDLSSSSIWLECPESMDLSIASASLKAVVSENYLTTEEQLKNFAPYFEINEYTNSIKWSFINPSTGSTVEPKISDLTINGKSVSGTSGNPTLDYVRDIRFSYTYNGVNYVWEFREMENNWGYGSFANLDYMALGTSRDVTVNLYSISELDAVEVYVLSTDILSVDKVSFTSADFVSDDDENDAHISFTATALKQGGTRVGLVFKRNSFTSIDNYVYIDQYVSVYKEGSSNEPVEVSLASEDLTASFSLPTYYVSIVEGVPNYLTSSTNSLLNVTLTREGLVSADYYNDNIAGHPLGTLYIYDSSNDVISSSDMYPGYSYYSSNYYQVRYYIDNLDENAARIAWVSSSDLIKDGSVDVPAKVDYRPYIKLNRDGLNATTLDYGFMDDEGNLLTDDDLPSPSVSVYGNSIYSYNNGGSTSGTITINVPDINISSISFYFYDNDVSYNWYFSPVDKVNYGSYVLDWNIDSPDLPLVMTVGDSLNVTLTNNNVPSPAAFIGNSSIVSMDFMSSTDNSVTVKLTALASGMTTITLASTTSRYAIAWPREIWVADKDGYVPHLTDDINALLELLTSDDITDGTSSRWYEDGDDDDSGSSSGNDDGKTTYQTGDPVDVLNGLSVKPRFVMPEDPTTAAYDAEWKLIEKEYRGDTVIMFEDNVENIEARDVRKVFNELSADLINRHPAQIPALILPAFTPTRWGTYTFRIPADNITLPGTRLFMHAFPEEDTEGHYNTNDDGYINVIGDINVTSENGTSILTEDYSVTVSVNMKDGIAQRVIVSSDIYLPEGLAYSVEATDPDGNITVLKVYADGKFYDVHASYWDEVIIPVLNAEDPEADYEQVRWSVRYDADEVNMEYYKDDGEKLEYISGDEYINVAVHLNGWVTYTPVITAQATSNDIKLIRNKIASQGKGGSSGGGSGGGGSIPNDDDEEEEGDPSAPSTPTNPVVSPDRPVNPASPDVPGTDSPDRPAGPESPDVPGIDSPDRPVGPTSPDVPGTDSPDRPAGPESPDVPGIDSPDRPAGPESPDVPGIDSPDRPAEPESPDIPGIDSPDNPGGDTPGGDDSGGDNSGGNGGNGGNSGGDNSGDNGGSGDNSGDNGGSGDNSGDNGGNGDNGDNSGGTEEPGTDDPGTDEPANNEPVAVTPDETKIDVTSQGTRNTILNIIRAINSVINQATELLELTTDELVDSERDTLTEEELEAIPEDEEPAVILPVMVVTKPGIYVFGVDLRNLLPRSPIRLHMMPKRLGAGSAELYASDEDSDAYTFLDDDGNEVTTVPDNQHVNVAAYMESGVEYAPVITTVVDDSGNGDSGNGDSGNGDSGNGGSGDSGGDSGGGDSGDDSSSTGPGSSSGGCSAADSFAPLALAVMLFTLRKKR